MRRVGARSGLTGLLAALAVFAGPGSPAVLGAADVEVLPPAQSVPLHSADNAHAYEAARPTRGRTVPLQVKPYRTPDPEGLRQLRELLRQSPHLLPPAPGFVEDRAGGQGE
ncbi:MAG: hypothetical protein DME04_21890 [Candidatus Rokuibacteriota bacterium]|nr:MAG: hypothetical protein DME04_21890 [Candidatus Rokubacteria bacterium]